MQKLATTIVLLMIAAGLSGCGWFSREDDDYRIARSAPVLEIPPGLRPPGANSSYEVPGEDGDDSQVTESFEISSNMSESWRRVVRALETMQQVSPRSVDQDAGRIGLSYRGEEGSGNVEIVLVPDSVSRTHVRVSGPPVAAAAVTNSLRNRLATGATARD